MAYIKDSLNQKTTADYLEQQLDWESVYPYTNKDFESDSLMNREVTV